jgi:hypothetical protein
VKLGEPTKAIVKIHPRRGPIRAPLKASLSYRIDL